jgi:pimeloyl-ACP methyl ester carboxylesterase
MIEIDVPTSPGGCLHAYDTGGDGFPVVWHHGTPNIGAPPRPLFAAADRLGLRWVSYDRPGYGGSTPRPGRDVASAAGDVAAVADALGLERFAVLGHSGGSPHALACAALLPDRVVAAVLAATLAPYRAAGLDWFAGMSDTGRASLGAALQGRQAKERYEATAPESDPGFAPVDWEALSTDWAWFHDVVRPALAAGPAPLVDDDLAYVAPWGFDPAGVDVPVLVLHGGLDRVAPAAHGRWIAEHVPGATWWPRPDDGHVSVLRGADDALAWLAGRLA